MSYHSGYSFKGFTQWTLVKSLKEFAKELGTRKDDSLKELGLRKELKELSQG